MEKLSKELEAEAEKLAVEIVRVHIRELKEDWRVHHGQKIHDHLACSKARHDKITWIHTERELKAALEKCLSDLAALYSSDANLLKE